MSLCWEKIETYLDEFEIDMENERVDVLKHLEASVPSNPAFAVIGANITRQVFFAREFARNPNLWNVHLAPAILRCMYELNVRLMWLVADPEPRCKAFIKASMHETTQLVKTIEKNAQASPDRKDLPEVHKSLHEWLSQQQQDFPSSDGGKMADVRKMAEKVQGEAIKMYRLYNSSLSPAVHSSWNFIEPVNLVRTKNPLHRYIQIPKIDFPPPDLEYFLSVSYFAHEALQIGRGADIGEKSSFEQLMQKLTSEDAQCKH